MLVKRLLQTSSTALAVFGLFLCQPANGHQPGSAPTQAPDLGPAQSVDPELAARISEVMRDWSIPGVAIAIVRADGQNIVQGFGVRQIGREEPVDGNTIFELGSTSKILNDAALATLVTQGKLHWTDTVKSVLPAFHTGSRWADDHVTIGDLASHRAALSPSGYPAESLHPVALPQLIEGAGCFSVGDDFRVRFKYNNWAHALIAKIISVKAQQPWGDYLSQAVFAPLGMDRTTTDRASLVQSGDLADCWYCAPKPGARIGSRALMPGIDNLAAPHGRRADGSAEVLPWSLDSGDGAFAGGISSSAWDVAYFLQMELHSGSAGGKAIISPNVIADMEQIKIATPELTNFYFGDGPFYRTRPSDYSGVGYGWFIIDYAGIKVFHHFGGQVGFASAFALIPSRGIAIGILTNQWLHPVNALSVDTLLHLVIDDYTGLAPIDWNALAKASFKQLRQSESDDKAAVIAALRHQPAMTDQAEADRVGTYDGGCAGLMAVSRQASRLYMRFSPTTRAILNPLGGGWYIGDIDSPSARDDPGSHFAIRFLPDQQISYFDGGYSDILDELRHTGPGALATSHPAASVVYRKIDAGK